MNELINSFIEEKKLALIGISSKKEKFGNVVLKELKEKGFEIYPVGTNISEFEGSKVYNKVEDLPTGINYALISVGKEKTESVLNDLIKKDIKNIWFLRGSYDQKFETLLKESNCKYIINKCILMYAEPVKSIHAFHKFLANLFGKY